MCGCAKVTFTLLIAIVYACIENCNTLPGGARELGVPLHSAPGSMDDLPGAMIVKTVVKPRMDRDLMEKYKLNRIKEDILRKLGMTHEPNTTRPDIPQNVYKNAVTKVLGQDQQMNNKTAKDLANVSGYYAAISEIIAFSELGKYS